MSATSTHNITECTTTTVVENADNQTGTLLPPRAVIVTLRARPRSKVKWDESVIDNENMGKKSSKSIRYEFA